MMVQRLVWLAASVAAPTQPREKTVVPAPRALPRWLVRRREAVWIAVLLLIAALAHGINMYHLPYFENDEGTYMSQAWAVLHEGQLAPYTYWYDHAPLGWIQISLWTLVTGGFFTFGPSANESGRVLMLVMQVGSTYMLYRIARAISGSVIAASVASLLFSLSAWGIYFHRRVLLDNISVFWMLLAIMLLVSGRFSLKKVWASAAALGISILSKELTVFLIPVLAYLVYYRAHRSQRGFATIGWTAITSSIVSVYALMAVLKGELLPLVPTLPAHASALQRLLARLGGTHAHVSLLGTLHYQGTRNPDAGIRDLHSAFWGLVLGDWSHQEPLLVIGGSVAAALCILLIKWQRLAGLMGLLTLALWAFLGRGGVTLGFYLVTLLPLLALNIALVLGFVAKGLAALLARFHRPGLVIGGGVQAALAVGCLCALALGYRSPGLNFQSDPTQLWTSTQSEAQIQAVAWIKAHIPSNKSLMIDESMWTALHDDPHGGPIYPRADWYWKFDYDPAIGGTVYHNNWRNVDYVIATDQMLGDIGIVKQRLTTAIMAHTTPVVRFDTGGWPVEILRVVKTASKVPAASTVTPRRTTGVAPANRRYLHGRAGTYWFNACVTGCTRASGGIQHADAGSAVHYRYWYDTCPSGCASVSTKRNARAGEGKTSTR